MVLSIRTRKRKWNSVTIHQIPVGISIACVFIVAEFADKILCCNITRSTRMATSVLDVTRRTHDVTVHGFVNVKVLVWIAVYFHTGSVTESLPPVSVFFWKKNKINVLLQKSM